MVVQPHAAHGLERQESTEEGTDERYQAIENGNGACNDVGDNGDACSAGEPDAPVLHGVFGQVTRSTEQANEDVLGGQLRTRVLVSMLDK